MPLKELLDESLEAEYNEVWERERTATPVRAFAVRLHSAGLSLRETAAILELLDVDRSHQAVWQWKERLADSAPDPPSAEPTRVAVDETAVKIGGEWQWVYAAIDVETKLLLDIAVFSRHGTDPAAAFLHGLTEKHAVENAVFLVDGFGYSTALSRVGLSGRLDYSTRNLIEKWFHTLKMRTDRFHTSWVGSRAAVRRWLRQFQYYYNHHRPALSS
jgi:transposase-like protein